MKKILLFIASFFSKSGANWEFQRKLEEQQEQVHYSTESQWGLQHPKEESSRLLKYYESINEDMKKAKKDAMINQYNLEPEKTEEESN